MIRQSAGHVFKYSTGQLCLLTLWALLSVGCGGDGESRATTQDAVIRNSAESCLQKGGASLAESVSDLSFVREATAREEVQKIGFAYDRETDQLVTMWTATSKEKRPPSWIVWFAENLDNVHDGNVTPAEVLENDDPGTYVYFARNLSAIERKRLAQCIRLEGGPAGDIAKINVH